MLRRRLDTIASRVIRVCLEEFGTPRTDWVGITCLGYHCTRGCELVANEGPAEPGWTWIDEHGWVCPDCIEEGWPDAA